MLDNFLGMLRKRRRIDEQKHSNSGSTTVWDSLFRTNTSNEQLPVNTTQVVDRPLNLNERFVSILDQLDARVENLRREAVGLQEKRDYLMMSLDVIKSNDKFDEMMDSEREEVACYIQRVSMRLATVELNVRTVRDHSQEDSLSQINMLIDGMIRIDDPVIARQRCQQYLNACGNAGESSGDVGVTGLNDVDKKFEAALLGCTLDDQKTIKKRLQALMSYLNQQTVQK